VSDAPAANTHTSITPPTGPTPSTDLLNIWLILYGCIFLLFTVIYATVKCRWTSIAAEQDQDFSPKADRLPMLRHTATAIIFLFAAWCIAWIIFGGIILFGSQGKTCKNSINDSGKKVYKSVLAFWILMLIGLPGLVACVVEAVTLEDPL
jgi:hypothetical protein